MPMPFEKQLRQRAQRFFSALVSAGFSATLDESSFDEYSVKLPLQPPHRGRICLYYSPKRRAFTMKTHLIPETSLASAIQGVWDHQEAHPFELADQNLAAFSSAVASARSLPPPKDPTPKDTERPREEAPSQASPLATSETAGTVDPKATFQPKTRPLGEADIHIYVDGSFQHGSIGFGWLILSDGRLVQSAFGCVTDPDLQSQRQVTGELVAAQHALLWCVKQKITQVSLFYDYMGIAAWITGEWQARQILTQTYRDFVRGTGIKIRWQKVKSHTGDLWNERADQLAGMGASSRKPFPLLTLGDLPSSPHSSG